MHFPQRLFVVPSLLAGILAMAACGGGPRMTYEPWEIRAAGEAARAIPIDFQTDAGNQTAFYVPPSEGADAPPHTLVLFYPGIGSRALDWLNWLGFDAPAPGVGYLLIDYPGRGRCQGKFRPKGQEANSRGAIDAVAARLGVTPASLEKDLALVGHSYGTGAALRFAQISAPRRIVLIAPFTTLRRALFRRIGPIAFILPDGMNNLARIKELSRRRSPPRMLILHGEADKSLPIGMGRKVARRGGNAVTLETLPDTGHVDILYKRRERILDWARGATR